MTVSTSAAWTIVACGTHFHAPSHSIASIPGSNTQYFRRALDVQLPQQVHTAHLPAGSYCR